MSTASESPMTTLLLVGKTGNGKSSTANTILDAGKELNNAASKFPVAHSFNSATVITESRKCEFDSQKIKVINTPDLANPPLDKDGKLRAPPETDQRATSDSKTNQASEESKDEWIKSQAKRWVKEAGGKPTAVLLVIRCDKRYTAEEFAIFQQLKEHLGDNMKDNLVIVFTMGDFLHQEGIDLKDELEKACKELKQVLEEAEDRYVVFDNKTNDADKKKDQVKKLLQVVNQLRK